MEILYGCDRRGRTRLQDPGSRSKRGPSLTETVKMCQSMCPSLNEAGEFNSLNEYAHLRERESVCVYVRGTEKERERVSECVCESVCVWVCVCVFVCQWDRERESQCV